MYYYICRNGDGLKSGGKVEVTGKELKVTGVNPLDNGIYRCIASNKGDSRTSTNIISVSVPGTYLETLCL
jgi:hypothetical protein